MLQVKDIQTPEKADVVDQSSKPSKQRILVVHRYYDPDTPPIASMLRSVCQRWHSLGHDVSVFTSQPCYKPKVKIPQQPWREQVEGVDVHRCWLPMAKSRNPLVRVFNFLAFLFFAFWKILLQRKKYDAVMCLTFPPVISAAVISTATWLRGSRFIYYMLDIHPESSTFTGKLKPSSLLAKIAAWVDRRSCRYADQIIVLSDDMANTYLSRFKDSDRSIQREKMHVIADFSPECFAEKSQPMPDEFAKQPDKFRILFAGNIGEFQAIDNLIETAHLLADHPEIEFMFVGEGSAKKRAMNNALELIGKTVHFKPHQPVAIADQIMQTADLCVVSLSPNLYKVAFPCKTSSYLAMGCPILVVLEPESELYRMTVDNNLGYACRGDDPQQLKETILDAYQNRERLKSMRQPAIEYAGKNLIPSALLQKWETVLDRSSRKQLV